jgi:hypothetical protein
VLKLSGTSYSFLSFGLTTLPSQTKRKGSICAIEIVELTSTTLKITNIRLITVLEFTYLNLRNITLT